MTLISSLSKRLWTRFPVLLGMLPWLAIVSGTVLRSQELAPSLQDVFRAGVEAEKAGRLDEAEQAFRRVLRGGGKVAFVYNNLGIVYQQKRDHARAVTQFREAIRLKPDYAAPRILLGASLMAVGNVPEATRQLERAVELQPKEPLAHLQLAKAYDQAENYLGAVDQLRILRGLAPQEPEYAYHLGRAYTKLAEWCYRQIVHMNPRSARVPQILGENYQAQGRLEWALASYKRAAHADPKLPGLHLAMAQVYLQMAKRAEALSEVEQELAITPESALAQALKQKLKDTDSGSPSGALPRKP